MRAAFVLTCHCHQAARIAQARAGVNGLLSRYGLGERLFLSVGWTAEKTGILLPSRQTNLAARIGRRMTVCQQESFNPFRQHTGMRPGCDDQ